MTEIDLTRYAANLAEQRDSAIASAQGSKDPETVEVWVARAAAFRHALVLLHLATYGKYGALDTDQPDPYAVPILARGSSAVSGVNPK